MGHLPFGIGAGGRGAIIGYSVFSSLLEGIRAQIPGNFGVPKEFARRGKTRIAFLSRVSRSEANFPQPSSAKGFDLAPGGNPDTRYK